MNDNKDNKKHNTKFYVGLIFVIFIIILVLLVSTGGIIYNQTHTFKSSKEQANELLQKSEHMSSFDQFRAKGGDAVQYTILKKCKNKDQLNESCVIKEIES